MSARGVKGASVAAGGTDGSDFSHRMVLAPRFEVIAKYRAQLARLFNITPFFYMGASLLTVLLHHLPGLSRISARFLPSFYLHLFLVIVTAAINIYSLRQQSKIGLLVLNGLATLSQLYLVILLTSQAFSPTKGEEIGFRWYLATGLLEANIVGLSALGIYYGYMISLLQGQQGGKKN